MGKRIILQQQFTRRMSTTSSGFGTSDKLTGIMVQSRSRCSTRIDENTTKCNFYYVYFHLSQGSDIRTVHYPRHTKQFTYIFTVSRTKENGTFLSHVINLLMYRGFLRKELSILLSVLRLSRFLDTRDKFFIYRFRF